MNGIATMASGDDCLLLDTDVMIDHLRGAKALAVSGDVAYSVVSRAELFAGTHVDEDEVRNFLSPFVEIEVTRQIAEQAGKIRRTLAINMPDALIAASALNSQRKLFTRNTRHFKDVKNLKLLST